MTALTDDVSGITVMPLGNTDGVFQWSVTLGDGTKRGFANSQEEGLERGQRAKRYLAAVESHNPDVLEAQAQTQSIESGRVELVSSWGGIIEVNEADVEQALASGCSLPGDDEPEQQAASESRPERARKRASQST